VNKYESEDLLKDKIFDTFSQWREEQSTDRFLKYYQDLCGQIFLWCKDYLFKKVNNMGEEIAVVTKRIMENKGNIPLDKKSYIKYITKALYNEKPSFYRKNNEEDIKIPNVMKSKIRESEGILLIKERNLGRELKKDEKIKYISDWSGISIKRAKNIVEAINISKIEFVDNNEEKNGSEFINPLDEYLIKIERKNIIEAVEYLINTKQKRARDCYRALFTLHCIENYKNYEGFNQVLDSQIIETWKKEDKYPNQYEIYQKFHPKAKKKGAEAMASKNLSDFLNEIKTYLKKSK
jgi:hypothetical protein